MLHMHLFFPIFATLISQKKKSIHIIRQHVKHDFIAIYYCPAHEHRSADMENSSFVLMFESKTHT